MGVGVDTMERNGTRNVGIPKRRGRSIEARVSALEFDMQTVKDTVSRVEIASNTAAENSAQIVSIMTAAKGVHGFAKKHGPRFVAFSVGILLAADIGNKSVLRFIGAFFG